MSTLILTLPCGDSDANPEYDYVLSVDGQQVTSQGRAVAAMLPGTAAGRRETVALLPGRALSWHRVALPEKVLRSMLSGRMEASRVRSVLAGVLEEQLLDEAEALHFAVFAAPPANSAGSNTAWVVACDRAWLHRSLHSLEAAGFSVGRIVAECTPSVGPGAHAVLTGALQPAQLVLCTPEGVSLLPLCTASVALAQTHAALEVRADPAVMALAEKHFGTQVQVQSRAQRALEAARSAWNLAQLELSATPGGRAARQMQAVWRTVWQAPAWRPARWGLLALVLVQIVALNALAWKQRLLLEDKRQAVQAVLRQTFPDVQLVVDAPLQMQRAVDDLALSRGAGSGADMAHILSLVQPALPPASTLNALDWSGKQLRLQFSALEPAALNAVRSALAPHDWQARLQDNTLVIEPREGR